MVVRAHARELSEAESAIEQAGDAMLLLISSLTWETLLRQSAAEGSTPGQVLGKALRLYIETHGSKEAVDYLYAVAGAK